MKKSLLVCVILMSLTLFCACERSENDLIGAWYNESERMVLIFSDGGKLTRYNISISWRSNPEIHTSSFKYNLTGDNQIAVTGDGSPASATYTYQVSGNSLQLSENGASFRLTRAKKTTKATNKIVGQWHLIGVENSGDTNYKRHLYEITFYSDGTMRGKKDNQWNETETVSGTYSFLHDGTTLQMAYPIAEESAVNFPCDDVMILHTYTGELLYIAQ